MKGGQRGGDDSQGDQERHTGRETQDMLGQGQWKVSVGKRWLMSMTKASGKHIQRFKKR